MRVKRKFGRLIRGLKPAQVVPKALSCVKIFDNWHHLLLIYAGLRQFSPRETFKIRGEGSPRVRVWEPIDVVTLVNVFCGPEYLVLPDDSFIIDIGANVGTFVVYAAWRAPAARIVAYEPVGYVFSRLVEQCQQAGLSDRVKLYNEAVGAADGMRDMYISGSDDVSSSFIPVGRWKSIQRVPVRSIASVMDDVQDRRISLLKLDCEGCEWEIIRGMSGDVAEIIDRVCVECHPVDSRDVTAIMTYLERFGFKLIKLFGRGRGSPKVAWFARP